MAKLILTDCYIEVNSTDFSDHVSSVEITASKNEVETTAFGSGGMERAHGLQDNSIVINFQQDFASSEVDSVLFPLWDNETEFTVAVRPTSDAVGSENPEYSATCVLLEYAPLNGAVGELSETSVTFPTQRDTFARATS